MLRYWLKTETDYYTAGRGYINLEYIYKEYMGAAGGIGIHIMVGVVSYVYMDASLDCRYLSLLSTYAPSTADM
jgi:Na+(H+)/acetate symporter ActP